MVDLTNKEGGGRGGILVDILVAHMQTFPK